MERINRYISILYRFGQRFFAQQFRGTLPVEVGQFPALMQALSAPGITQDEISRNTCIDKGATARSVRLLEEAGLIRRETDAEDRRINHVYPTQLGQECKKPILKAIEDLHIVLYQGFSEDEARQATALLTRMQENMRGYFGEK